MHLGVPVQAVGWSGPGVRVAVEGAELEAEACLLAVPASVIGRIRFDPPLPAWKAEALERVVYGHAAKLFVPLRRVPPPSAVLSVPDLYWTWTARGADGAVQPVVSAFAGSAPALAALEVAGRPGDLAPAPGRAPPRPGAGPGPVLSTWDDDPWVEAAYSTRTPAFRPDDPALLARPVGPLHFAGEHTAGPWSGLMEGALRSGHRAATELLATTPADGSLPRRPGRVPRGGGYPGAGAGALGCPQPRSAGPLSRGRGRPCRRRPGRPGGRP